MRHSGVAATVRFASYLKRIDIGRVVNTLATHNGSRLALMLGVSTVAHLTVLSMNQRAPSAAEHKYLFFKQQDSPTPLHVSIGRASSLPHPSTITANSPLDSGKTTHLKPTYSSNDKLLNTSESSPPGVAQPDSKYFTVSELSTKPKLMGDLAMDHIALLADETERRSAQFELMISEYGRVDQIEIYQSDFPDLVVQSMVSTLKAAQFFPGKIGSTPVRSRFRIELNFDPNVN